MQVEVQKPRAQVTHGVKTADFPTQILATPYAQAQKRGGGRRGRRRKAIRRIQVAPPSVTRQTVTWPPRARGWSFTLLQSPPGRSPAPVGTNAGWFWTVCEAPLPQLPAFVTRISRSHPVSVREVARESGSQRLLDEPLLASSGRKSRTPVTAAGVLVKGLLNRPGSRDGGKEVRLGATPLVRSVFGALSLRARYWLARAVPDARSAVGGPRRAARIVRPLLVSPSLCPQD